MVILLALASAAAHQPSAEAIRLGTEIASRGTLAALLPIKEQQDTAELLAEDKTLSAAEQEKLKAVVQAYYAEGTQKLFAATGRSYAEQLSLADLRAIAAFYRSGVAKRFQVATPTAIIDTIKTVGDVDGKKEARVAFCKETGKLCGQ